MSLVPAGIERAVRTAPSRRAHKRPTSHPWRTIIIFYINNLCIIKFPIYVIDFKSFLGINVVFEFWFLVNIKTEGKRSLRNERIQNETLYFRSLHFLAKRQVKLVWSWPDYSKFRKKCNLQNKILTVNFDSERQWKWLWSNLLEIGQNFERILYHACRFIRYKFIMVKLIHLSGRFHAVVTSWLAVLRNPEQLKSITVFLKNNFWKVIFHWKYMPKFCRKSCQSEGNQTLFRHSKFHSRGSFALILKFWNREILDYITL